MLHCVDESAIADDGAEDHEICDCPDTTARPVYWMLVRHQGKRKDSQARGHLLNRAAYDRMRLCRLALLQNGAKTPAEAPELQNKKALHKRRSQAGPQRGRTDQHNNTKKSDANADQG